MPCRLSKAVGIYCVFCESGISHLSSHFCLHNSEVHGHSVEGTERHQERCTKGHSRSPPAVLLMATLTDPNASWAPDPADSAGKGRAKRRLLAVPPSRLANGRGLRVSLSLISGRYVAINVD